MPYLLRALRPRLTRALGEDAATAVFLTNPARAFSAHWITS